MPSPPTSPPPPAPPPPPLPSPPPQPPRPFNVAEFTLRLELKANSWSTSWYPYLVDDSGRAIVLHGMGSIYGANFGKISFNPDMASGGRSGVNLYSTSPWSTGTWHTLVLRKTQTQVCLFKNGVEDGCHTFTTSNTDIAVPGHLQLAVAGTASYNNEWADSRFDGELRNLEIFPCALSSPTAAGCISGCDYLETLDLQWCSGGGDLRATSLLDAFGAGNYHPDDPQVCPMFPAEWSDGTKVAECKKLCSHESTCVGFSFGYVGTIAPAGACCLRTISVASKVPNGPNRCYEKTTPTCTSPMVARPPT